MGSVGFSIFASYIDAALVTSAHYCNMSTRLPCWKGQGWPVKYK